MFFRLCDLSTCKRVPKTSVAALARGNGMIESKKTTKKAAKEDLVDKFLANSDDTENPIDSEEEKPECEEEKPERAEYTEQNFLQEKNLQCLQNLLEDSSEGDESDDENEMNGKFGGILEYLLMILNFLLNFVCLNTRQRL